MRIKRIGKKNSLSVSSWSGISNPWIDETPPAGWGWSIPVKIKRKVGTRRFRLNNFNIYSYLVPSTKAYYVSPTGNDLEAGDETHPFRSIKKALGMADADTVYIQAGVYVRSYSWDGIALTRSMNIIAVGGPVVCTNAQDGLTWTLNTGSTYSTSRTNAAKILDVSIIDANGDFQELVSRGSIAEVDANPGSYYYATPLLYVRTSDSRVPDANIWVTLNTRNGKISGDVKVFCKGIRFIGGYAGLEFDNTAISQNSEFYALDCYFAHSIRNGLEITGQVLSVTQNCYAYRNDGDGFNYKAQFSTIPKVIEYYNRSRANGLTGDEDNGSSAHDGASILRVMGQHERSLGPVIVESAALESWLLGVLSRSSLASIAGARLDFNTTGGSGKMWLDRCSNAGSSSDYSLNAGAGTTIYKRLCYLPAGSEGGAGTISAY